MLSDASHELMKFPSISKILIFEVSESTTNNSELGEIEMSEILLKSIRLLSIVNKISGPS